jgi:hypothetical protein
LADPNLATDGAAGTAIASVVVTIRRDRSGEMTIHVEPTADHGGEELVPASLDAYVTPGPPDAHPRPLRRRRSTLTGGPSANAGTGRGNKDATPVPRRRRLPTTAGIQRKSATAAAVAVLAAFAAVILMTSPVTRPSTPLEPATLPSRESPSLPASVAAPAECCSLPAWINGLYGIYGNGTGAQ